MVDKRPFFTKFVISSKNLTVEKLVVRQGLEFAEKKQRANN